MTCDVCLGGRHWKCGGRDGCGCAICATKAKPRSPVRLKATRSAIRQPRVPKEVKPKRPKRSYPAELVARAQVLKLTHSWAEVAAELGVPVQGIRYAVNAYAPEVDTSELEKIEALQRLAALQESIVAARLQLVAVEQQATELTETLAGLRVELDSVEGVPAPT